MSEVRDRAAANRRLDNDQLRFAVDAKLYEDVLAAIADGHPEPRALARAALGRPRGNA